jgi:1-acyl-sn-glycerol-3-phosphate acyltransferase
MMPEPISPPPAALGRPTWAAVAAAAGTCLLFGAATRVVGADWFPHGRIALAAGAGAGLLYWHRYRGLGLAAVATASLLVAAIIAAVLEEWTAATVVTLFFSFGAALIRLVLFLSRWMQNTDVGPPGCLLIALFCGAALIAGIYGPQLVLSDRFLWLPIGSAALLLLYVVFLFRPIFEFCSEPLLWLMYAVRGVGPGQVAMPPRGPCLVIANHACWFDPLFLAKVLPRPITALMTSRFYDKPGLKLLFKYVFHAIRVPEKALKEDVPEEIRAAIVALDRGECVVIFPEGFLRRSEARPLRRFGRGVWQILSARPRTPVYCCWIEGGWGSYCSYFNGNPTKNKKLDLRRPIGVAVPDPLVVDEAILANHLETRVFLMNRVLAARTLLGLKELPPFELPNSEEE